MKPDIIRLSNFELLLSYDDHRLNLDDLRTKITGKVLKRKKMPHVWPDIKLTLDSVTIEACIYLAAGRKDVNLIVSTKRLVILREDNADVAPPEHLSIYEFLVLKHLEENSILKRIFDFFTDERYPLAKQYPADFSWKATGMYLDNTIRPEDHVGKVFLPSEIKAFHKTMNRVDKSFESWETIGFCIPTLKHFLGYPILKPFLGRTTLDGKNIRSFNTFKTEQITPILSELSNNQIALLKIAERLEELSEPVDKVLFQKAFLEEQIFESKIWTLWEKAIHLLKRERFVFSYFCYRKKQFKNRPRKTDMSSIEFSEAKFQPAFELTEIDDRFLLKAFMLHNGKYKEVEQSFPDDFPMFYRPNKYDPLTYTASCLRDVKIWKWITHKDIFTIHKTYCEEFIKSVLPELCSHYPIKFKFKVEKNLYIQTYRLTAERKWLCVSQTNNSITLTPYIKYLERKEPVNILTKGTQWLLFDGDNRTVQIRDKKEEKAFKKLIYGLHPTFKEQASEERPMVSMDEFIRDYWFLEAFSILKKADIPVEGLDSLKGFGYHPYSPDIQMDVQAKKGWFDIGLQVRFGDNLLDFEQLRNAIIKQDGKVKLKGGKEGIIPSKWQDKLRGMLSLGQEKNGKLSLSKLHFPMVEKLYGKNAPKDITDWIKAKRKRLENPVLKDGVKLPMVRATLRPYQKAGFYWMKALQEEEWGGILADDMGLGKTLQVLTLLLHTKEDGEKQPSLIVATKSLLYNWEEQAAKFTPDLTICKYYGHSRQQLQEGLHQFDLVITTYDTVKSDIRFFGNMEFQYLITDEAQAIKNTSTDRYKAINLLNARYRLALSGTPVENSVVDLYALMNFVNPGFFGTEANFRKIFLQKGRVDKSPRMEALQTAVKPFILRRTKEKVAKDLPEKTEMVMYCEMEPQQRKAYESLRNYYKGELEDKISTEGLNNSKLKILEGLMRLRQVCDHPVLVPDHYNYEGNSAKMEALMEQVIEKTANHKLLVFSQFTGMLKLIGKALEKEGVCYSYLDGQTSEASRKKAVKQFQEDNSVRVFLLSLKAGGSGLNLTAGDYVFLVDPWWNPAVESQAIDRCYRIGQDKKVMAYRMICKDTIEEKILQMQHEKKELAAGLIQSEEGLFKSLDTKGLLELFGE
ncbi:DEAD/DEAH box helicase [Echinicola soli]|uniref:DEAD/DEAH box helicase n=1 Tax=Echinicola soli TaxID=2591634 RepID=A0A514CDQ6_9BACT|nr:DEAD/DEAH box helicase [Echinicola soli]QDH77948.1 DEAD/DEAH box helicase [Echinicola soli]